MAEDLIRLMHALFTPAAGNFRDVVWRPAADVYRTRDGWLVKLDLAGVRPEDLSVEVEGPQLTVRGVRKDCVEEEDCRCYTLEISYSHFERTLTLPVNLDNARLRADYRDGMLLVRIEKEEAQRD